MNRLGPDARALIEAAADGEGPSAEDEARVRSKLAARLAIAAGATTTPVIAAAKITMSAMLPMNQFP